VNPVKGRPLGGGTKGIDQRGKTGRNLINWGGGKKEKNRDQNSERTFWGQAEKGVRRLTLK